MAAVSYLIIVINVLFINIFSESLVCSRDQIILDVDEVFMGLMGLLIGTVLASHYDFPHAF